MLVLLRHVAEGLEAEWTLILMLSKLLEASLMHRVTAVQIDTKVPTLVHVLQADRAVAFSYICYVALMVLSALH